MLIHLEICEKVVFTITVCVFSSSIRGLSDENLPSDSCQPNESWGAHSCQLSFSEQAPLTIFSSNRLHVPTGCCWRPPPGCQSRHCSPPSRHPCLPRLDLRRPGNGHRRTPSSWSDRRVPESAWVAVGTSNPAACGADTVGCGAWTAGTWWCRWWWPRRRWGWGRQPARTNRGWTARRRPVGTGRRRRWGRRWRTSGTWPWCCPGTWRRAGAGGRRGKDRRGWCPRC